MPMTRVTRVRPRLRPPVTRRDDVLSDVDHTPPMSMSMGQSASPCRSVTYILLLLYMNMCTMVQLCTAVPYSCTSIVHTAVHTVEPGCLGSGTTRQLSPVRDQIDCAVVGRMVSYYMLKLYAGVRVRSGSSV